MIKCAVETPEVTLMLYMYPTDSGKNILDKVFLSLGLKEIWHFGFLAMGRMGQPTWIDMDAPIMRQNIRTTSPLHLQLAVKFYPEEVTKVIQRISRWFIFQQVRHDLTNGIIHCPPEYAIVLASFGAQARFGDFDPQVQRKGFLRRFSLLPLNLRMLGKQEKIDFEPAIINQYKRRQGMAREDAVIKFLQLAQDLEMFSVRYFSLTANSGVPVGFAGMSPYGVMFFTGQDQRKPDVCFHWGEIKRAEVRTTALILYMRNAPSDLPLVLETNNWHLARRMYVTVVSYYDLFARNRKNEVDDAVKHVANEEEEATGSQPSSSHPRSEHMIDQLQKRAKGEVEATLMAYERDMRPHLAVVQESEYECQGLEKECAHMEGRLQVAEAENNDARQYLAFYDDEMTLTKSSVPTLIRNERKVRENAFQKEQIRNALSGRNNALMAEMERARNQLNERRRQLLPYTVPPHLLPHDGGIDMNEEGRDQGYEFNPIEPENEFPWENREPYHTQDQAVMEELQALRPEFEGIRQGLGVDSTILNKYQYFSQKVHLGVEERLESFNRLVRTKLLLK